jgi:hypothetical protein
MANFSDEEPLLMTRIRGEDVDIGDTLSILVGLTEDTASGGAPVIPILVDLRRISEIGWIWYAAHPVPKSQPPTPAKLRGAYRGPIYIFFS